MVVADITDNVILGIYFLDHQNAIINFNNYSIQLKNEVINSVMVTDKQEGNTKIFRVKLGKRTVIPPCSNRISIVELDSTPDSDIIIQPTEFMKGLLVPNMLCEGKKSVSILLKNPTDKFKTLKQGYDMGYGIEVSNTIDDIEQDDIFKINKVDAELQHLSETDQLKNLKSKLPEHMKDLCDRSTTNLNTRQSIQLCQILTQFENIFARDDLDIGLFNGDIKHRIDTQDAHPIKQRMRRTPLGFEKEEEEHLEQLLNKKIIEPSSSEWASPPVLVRKKDEKLRYCIDYRKLNNITVKDAFPIPKIETCLDTLRGS